LIKKTQFKHKLAIFVALLSLVLSSVKPQTAYAAEGGFWSFLSFGGSAQADQSPLFPEHEDRDPRKVASVVVTVYSSTPDQTDDSPFITSNGRHVYDGLVAANWLPYGTRVRFPDIYGDKVFTVNDRMNERYGYGHIDIWMDKPISELREFGVKRIKMEIF